MVSPTVHRIRHQEVRVRVDGADTQSCPLFTIPITIHCSIYLRYVNASVEKTSWYIRHIREYFEEKWTTTEKPFRYSERQMKKLGLSSPESQARRSVCCLTPYFLYERKFHSFHSFLTIGLWLNSQQEREDCHSIQGKYTYSTLSTPTRITWGLRIAKLPPLILVWLSLRCWQGTLLKWWWMESSSQVSGLSLLLTRYCKLTVSSRCLYRANHRCRI